MSCFDAADFDFDAAHFDFDAADFDFDDADLKSYFFPEAEFDTSDLDSALHEALTGNRANEMASEAQALYKKYLFGEQAGELFCDRFQNIVS